MEHTPVYIVLCACIACCIRAKDYGPHHMIWFKMVEVYVNVIALATRLVLATRLASVSCFGGEMAWYSPVGPTMSCVSVWILLTPLGCGFSAIQPAVVCGFQALTGGLQEVLSQVLELIKTQETALTALKLASLTLEPHTEVHTHRHRQPSSRHSSCYTIKSLFQGSPARDIGGC